MNEERWRRKMRRFERKMDRWGDDFGRRMDRVGDDFGREWERRWERRHNSSRHLFPGLLLLIIGMVFLLGNMGMVDTGAIFRFWPVILIAVGLFKLVESGDDYGHSSGIFWIVVGGLFLIGNLGILPIRFRDFWPVVLIGIGALLLWRSTLARPRSRRFTPEPAAAATAADASFEETPSGTAGAESSGPATSAASSDAFVSAMAILGNVERRNNCQDFRGGSATAVMGRCELDLRAASIASPNEPVIEVFALWGGIEIRVPPDWTIVSRVGPVMGGYEDDTQPPKDTSKRLIVDGTVVMGGIEVTN